MGIRAQALVSILLSLLAQSAFADVVADAKTYWDKALQVYVESGPKPFIEYTMKNGALEGNPQALSQANILQQIQDIAGKPATYEISSITKLSDRTVEVLYVIHLDKAAIFGSALVYRTTGGSMAVVQVNFNTAPEKVWPQIRVYGMP